MAITWFSEEQVERMFEETLSDWAKNQGYKGCYSADETRKYAWQGVAWARNSATAKKIMEHVLLDPREIIVVGMRGGFQCFNSTEGPQGNLPVVYIDIDGKLESFVRGPHNLHLDPEKCTGARVSIDNRIAMLHEFGHAKQWMERPALFDNQPKAPAKTSPEAEARRLATGVKPGRTGSVREDARAKALKLGGAERDLRLGATRAGLASDISAKATELWSKKGSGDTSFVRGKGELETFEKGVKEGPQWGRAIEMDNMARHEWPICRELGLPLRTNYRDIHATSDGQPSLTSQIRRKAEEAERRAREHQEAKAAELQKLQGSASVLRCSCGQAFPSAMKLNMHKIQKSHS